MKKERIESLSKILLSAREMWVDNHGTIAMPKDARERAIARAQAEALELFSWPPLGEEPTREVVGRNAKIEYTSLATGETVSVGEGAEVMGFDLAKGPDRTVISDHNGVPLIGEDGPLKGDGWKYHYGTGVPNIPHEMLIEWAEAVMKPGENISKIVIHCDGLSDALGKNWDWATTGNAKDPIVGYRELF